MTNHRGRSFALLTLAAAISSEAHGAVTANPDDISLPVDKTSVVNILANDALPSALPVYYDTSYITGGGYVDSHGQSADPFTNPPQGGGFVVVCASDPSHGSLVVNDSGQLAYTPDPGYEGQDGFDYEIDQYGVTNGTATQTSVDYTVANLTLTTEAPVASTLVDRVSGRNRKRVAAALDNLCSSTSLDRSSALAQRCSELEGLAGLASTNLNDIIGQITPDEVLALRRVAADAVSGRTDLIYRQLQAERQGKADADVTLNQQAFSILNYRGGSAGDAVSPWSSFISLQYGRTRYDGGDLEATYDADSKSLTAGGDYRLSSRWLVGTAVTWVDQGLDYTSDTGKADGKVYDITGYLSYSLQQLNLDVQLGYGSGDYNIQRNIRYTGVDTQARGSTNANLYSFSSQLDWTWAYQSWEVRPYLRADFLRAEIDGFTEQGGMGWAVVAGDQNLDQWTSSLGVDTRYTFSTSWGVWVPGITLSVLNQTSRDYKPVSFRFAGDSSGLGDFSLLTQGEDSLFYRYELSSVWVFKHGMTAYISYQGTASFANANVDQFNIGGRMEF